MCGSCFVGILRAACRPWMLGISNPASPPIWHRVRLLLMDRLATYLSASKMEKVTLFLSCDYIDHCKTIGNGEGVGTAKSKGLELQGLKEQTMVNLSYA